MTSNFFDLFRPLSIRPRSLITPKIIKNTPINKKTGKMIKVIIPIYGLVSGDKNSRMVRNRIRPKLSAARPAPDNVTGLYTICGKIFFTMGNNLQQ